jgi:hypothetical protein
VLLCVGYTFEYTAKLTREQIENLKTIPSDFEFDFACERGYEEAVAIAECLGLCVPSLEELNRSSSKTWGEDVTEEYIDDNEDDCTEEVPVESARSSDPINNTFAFDGHDAHIQMAVCDVSELLNIEKEHQKHSSIGMTDQQLEEILQEIVKIVQHSQYDAQFDIPFVSDGIIQLNNFIAFRKETDAYISNRSEGPISLPSASRSRGDIGQEKAGINSNEASRLASMFNRMQSASLSGMERRRRWTAGSLNLRREVDVLLSSVSNEGEFARNIWK